MPNPWAVLNNGIFLSLNGLVPTSGSDEICEICLMWNDNSIRLSKSTKATLLCIIELYRVEMACARFDVVINSSHTIDMGNSTESIRVYCGGDLYPLHLALCGKFCRLRERCMIVLVVPFHMPRQIY